MLSSNLNFKPNIQESRIKNGIVDMYAETPKHTQDDHILYLLKNRDAKGISLLYDQFSTNVYGVIFRLLGNEKDACEAMKSTFKKIWILSAQVDFSNRNFKTWIIGLACKEAAILAGKPVSSLPKLLLE